MQPSMRKLSFACLIAFDAGVARTSRFIRPIILLGVLASTLSLATPSVCAQTPNAGHPPSFIQQQTLRATLNNNSLIVVTGHPDASYLAMAHDLAAALGKSADVQLLPIAASGGVENLRALVFLRGVDLAIVPGNVLAETKALEALLGVGLPQRLGYVTHLYAEEVHLLVGSRISSLGDLHGTKIAVPLDDGNAEFTARDLFQRLGVEAEIASLRPAEAIERVRSDELSAALFVGGKPLQLVSNLPRDGRLRLLRLPFSKATELGYVPAAFRAEDYPSLIPPGLTVETVAVSAILMANTAKGYEESTRRIAKFVPLFFAGAADLSLLARHPKWKELNLATPLPGWTRLPTAEEWLRNAKEQQRAVLQRGFDEFLRATRLPGSPEITPERRKKLLDEFVEWTRQSVSPTTDPARPRE